MYQIISKMNLVYEPGGPSDRLAPVGHDAHQRIFSLALLCCGLFVMTSMCQFYHFKWIVLDTILSKKYFIAWNV